MQEDNRLVGCSTVVDCVGEEFRMEPPTRRFSSFRFGAAAVVDVPFFNFRSQPFFYDFNLRFAPSLGEPHRGLHGIREFPSAATCGANGFKCGKTITEGEQRGAGNVSGLRMVTLSPNLSPGGEEEAPSRARLRTKQSRPGLP